MQKEIDERMKNNNSIIERSEVPKGTNILPAHNTYLVNKLTNIVFIPSRVDNVSSTTDKLCTSYTQTIPS